jgi:hypothetical protein
MASNWAAPSQPVNTSTAGISSATAPSVAGGGVGEGAGGRPVTALQAAVRITAARAARGRMRIGRVFTDIVLGAAAGGFEAWMI